MGCCERKEGGREGGRAWSRLCVCVFVVKVKEKRE